MTADQSSQTHKLKWPKKVKTYNPRWESDPVLKTWVNRHSSDIGKAVCLFCKSEIRAHKNDLLEHSRTLKHQRNFMKKSTPGEYSQFIKDLNERKEIVPMKKRPHSSHAAYQSPPPTPPSLKTKNPLSGTSTESITTTGVTNTVPPISVILPGLTKDDVDDDTLREVIMEGDELWSHEEDDFSNSSESPSNLVNVIIEEQQSPSSTSQCQSQNITQADSSNLQSLNGMVLTELSKLGNVNFTLVDTLTTPKLVAATPNAILSNQSTDGLPIVTVSTDQTPNDAVTSSILLSAKPEISSSFNISDVLTAIEQGCFSILELCTLARTVLNQIEYNASGNVPSGVRNATFIEHVPTTMPITVSISDGIFQASPSQVNYEIGTSQIQ